MCEREEDLNMMLMSTFIKILPITTAYLDYLEKSRIDVNYPNHVHCTSCTCVCVSVSGMEDL